MAEWQTAKRCENGWAAARLTETARGHVRGKKASCRRERKRAKRLDCDVWKERTKADRSLLLRVLLLSELNAAKKAEEYKGELLQLSQKLAAETGKARTGKRRAGVEA